MSYHTTFYTTLAKSVYNIWVLWARIRTHNPKVIGSNPIPATKHLKGLIALCVKPFFILAMDDPAVFKTQEHAYRTWQQTTPSIAPGVV